MVARRGSDESLINSIVGAGTFFRGHLELSGLLRIDGDFSGSVKTAGRVIIGQAGRGDCAIQAGIVVIGGLFKGEILATEKVVLLSSSIVIGTITAPRLVAEDGVLLSGRFRIVGDSEDLLASGDFVAKRKELLLESVRTRETSPAVAGREAQTTERRQHDGTDPESLAVVRGGSGEWNG